MSVGRLSKKAFEIAERRNVVLQLRLEGRSFRDIAEALKDPDNNVPGVTPKYTYQLAYHDALVEMQRLGAENKELAQYELDTQLEQLRELWTKFYSMALERGDYNAFDRLMVIQKRRATLLNVEPPTKIAPTDPTGREPYDAPLSDTDRLARLAQLLDIARTRRDGQATDTGGTSASITDPSSSAGDGSA